MASVLNRRSERPSNLSNYVFILLLLYILTFLFINHYLESGQKYPELFNSFKGLLTDTFISNPTIDTYAFIVNTYYYPKSKSLGDNAIAMVLLMNRNTMREITKYRMTLTASNGTSSVTVVPKLVKEVYATCAYVNVVAKVNALPNLTSLQIEGNGEKMEIPFKTSRLSAPKPVIICIAPQFVAEQWQLFITHAHVANRFGGHLHLYVTSIIDSYFDLVNLYEKEGYVTLDYWVRPKFSNSQAGVLEPNANSEWRNQAGAHTDCLLQYKEVATFITFFDLDDVLFPHGFYSYYDEFAFLSFLNPSIKTFHYEKRPYKVQKILKLPGLNFTEMFSSTSYEAKHQTGKVMARPVNLDSMWIHHSFNTKDQERLFLRQNFITHVQIPKGRNETVDPESGAEGLEGFQKDPSVLGSIQKDFERMLDIPELQEITRRLPKDNFYFPIIYKCYFDKYYGKSAQDREKMCPNSEGCELPQREDLKCIHSHADYVAGPRMSPITFNYHKNTRWSEDYGCYQ